MIFRKKRQDNWHFFTFFGNKIIGCGSNSIYKNTFTIDINVHSQTCIFLFCIIYYYDNKQTKTKKNKKI